MAVQPATRPQRSRSAAMPVGPRGFAGAAWDRIKLIATGVAGFLGRTYVSIAIVLAILVFLIGGGYIHLPFPPFETTGKVFVGSPEIYTRERLVNDRYDQDFWYREQLGNLDKSDSLITAYLETAARLAVNSPAPGNAAATPPATSDSSATRVPNTPFDQEFRIRAGIRDSIRHLILENMLDDRHDLTGNSLYGLKFDTTVVPGASTSRRAFVRITIPITEPFPDTVAGEVLPEYVKLYYDNKADQVQYNSSSEVRDSFALYANWMDSVLVRLNEYVNNSYPKRLYPSDCNESEMKLDSDIFTKDILASVLGIELKPGVTINELDPVQSVSLPLPSEWSRFLTIVRSGGTCTSRKPVFSVHSVADNLFLFPKSKGGKIPDWAAGAYSVISTEDNPKWTVTIPKSAKSTSSIDSASTKYPISLELIDYAEQHGKLRRLCLDIQPDPSGSCMREIFLLGVEAGFFNFVQAISVSDAYVYALFPKSESVAYQSDQSFGADLATPASGELPGVLGSFFRRLRGTESEAVFVGYADGDAGRIEESAANQVQFGWVISGMGNSPVQKSTLALVSVPAWTVQLSLTVSVGWLDRYSNEHLDRQFTTTVRLPPDYEAFDSFIAGGQGSTGPKILGDFLGSFELVACQPADVVVPGYRLWRSTSVTLGSQLADRITVLPNMQGVMAQFKRVNFPTTEIEGEFAPGRLRVWTSEGVAEVVDKPVSIRVPASIQQARACPPLEAGKPGPPVVEATAAGGGAAAPKSGENHAGEAVTETR